MPVPYTAFGTLTTKQAISAREQALCQLTVYFEFQIRSERRKGHKSCALQMILRSIKLTIKG